jgi:hypothetical protein
MRRTKLKIELKTATKDVCVSIDRVSELIYPVWIRFTKPFLRLNHNIFWVVKKGGPKDNWLRNNAIYSLLKLCYHRCLALSLPLRISYCHTRSNTNGKL